MPYGAENSASENEVCIHLLTLLDNQTQPRLRLQIAATNDAEVRQFSRVRMADTEELMRVRRLLRL